MYPLPAVLVNFSESNGESIRSAMIENAVSIVKEFPTIEALLDHWSSPPDTTRRMLVVKLRSLEDVQQMGRLDTCFPGWPLLALVEGDYDAAGLLQVSRAGAAQILPTPFKKDDLGAALDRLLLQFGLRETPCRVIAMSGVVEGCGATSVAVSLAAELAAIGRVPCVLTEMSFGIGRLAVHLNLAPMVTTRELLAAPTELNLGTVKAALVQAGNHLSVLAGQSRTLEPFSVAPGRLARLFRMLRQMSSFVIVDMPYTFDPHYFEALAAADRVLLVARQDVPAIQAAKLLKHTLVERGIAAPGLVLNHYESKRSAFSCEAISKLLQIEQVFPIATDASGHQAAVNAGRPLREVVPNSAAVADVRALATSILEAAGIRPHLPPVRFRDRLRTLLTRIQT
ncbi:MAG: hypothetical protein K8U57_12505 [Planctomycetes bacterium]|nr:hypothetical protein [Planctomycetota bacterium]